MKKVKLVDNKVVNKAAIITIELIHGQSFEKDIIFDASYSFIDSSIISSNIARILKPSKDPYTDIYVECDDEQLKLDVISEIIRENKDLQMLKEQNKPGASWGMNVYVSLPGKG